MEKIKERSHLSLEINLFAHFLIHNHFMAFNCIFIKLGYKCIKNFSLIVSEFKFIIDIALGFNIVFIDLIDFLLFLCYKNFLMFYSFFHSFKFLFFMIDNFILIKFIDCNFCFIYDFSNLLIGFFIFLA